MNISTLVDFNHVSKEYSDQATALRSISFSVHAGEFTALAGPSGSGKTTVLNLAAGLDLASNGSVKLLGREIGELSKNELSLIRRQFVGFIFQSYNLFPVLTGIENIEYPLALLKVPKSERQERALGILKEVGLENFADRLPNQLSGGQQQRVAIARAMVTRPQIVFADEPTANLDSKTAEGLLDLFKELNENRGTTFLFSSHDPMVLARARRTLQLCDGAISNDSKRKKSTNSSLG